MTQYDYAVEIGTDYMSDLEVDADSNSLCDDVKKRFQAFLMSVL